MTRPTLVSKREPAYPREALVAKVGGLMLVKCVITTEGNLQRCRIVKGLPFMDQPVLQALASWKYTPVLFQGRPVTVEYVIPVRLVPP
jgi:protein TonB